jgi:hypothetical protein
VEHAGTLSGMENVPSFTQRTQPSNQPQRVRVTGRDDIGEIVDGGKNFGANPSIYCVGVHFPTTGECVYYDKSRVQHVEE